jgi:predicted DNA-binding transcriptional regulator AlpA
VDGQTAFYALPQVSRITTLSRATIYRGVNKKTFPQPVRISANRIAWPVDAIHAWAAAKMGAA